jgi:hypothetical protein
MSFAEDLPWREPSPAPKPHALVSQFPGELALRDAKDATTRLAQICAARFAVLQLVERYLARDVDPARWTLELSSAASYLEPLEDLSPTVQKALRQVLDRLDRNEARDAPLALLVVGDDALVCGHMNGAWGFFNVAYELGVSKGRNAIGLSAASRLANLAVRLQKPLLARKWERRSARMLASCQ